MYRIFIFLFSQFTILFFQISTRFTQMKLNLIVLTVVHCVLPFYFLISLLIYPHIKTHHFFLITTKDSSSQLSNRQTWCSGRFVADRLSKLWKFLFRHGFLHICVWGVALTQAGWQCRLLPGTTTHEKKVTSPALDDVSTQRHPSQRTCMRSGLVYVMEHSAFLPTYPFLASGENEAVVCRLPRHNLKININLFPHSPSAALVNIRICLFLAHAEYHRCY